MLLLAPEQSHKSDKQSRKDEFWKFLKVIYNKSETGRVEAVQFHRLVSVPDQRM